MLSQNKLNSADSGEPIYSSIQKFHVRNSFGDERQRDLRIVLALTSRFTHASISKHVLQIQVLDEDDPFFYYTLIVTEHDYLTLKTSQGLLVDFESFPAEVIRLLEQCKGFQPQVAKFLLFLEDENSKTMLKIVEKNNFKHLYHLVLQIEPGNGDDIKQIMVHKIKSLKEQNIKAEKLILNLEAQINSKNQMLESSEIKLNELERRLTEDRMAFRAETAKELSEESDKLRRAQLDWQIKNQQDIAELEGKYKKTVHDKDSELSKLKIENKILVDKKRHLEELSKEHIHRIQCLEKELMGVQVGLTSSQNQLVKFENDLREKERHLCNLKSKLSISEKDLRDKTALLSKQEDLLKNIREQNSRLEGSVQDKEAHIVKKQKTIQNVSEELIKANDIISKLQKELAGSSSKLKMRTEIAIEQEKVISKHEKTIDRLEKELKNKSKRLESMDNTESTLQTTISELNVILDSRNKKIKENEKIIDWLNRRCTEQAVQSYVPTHSNFDVYSTPAHLPESTFANLGLGHQSSALRDDTSCPPSGGPLKTSSPHELPKPNRVPFTTASNRFAILALDKIETPTIIEESVIENDIDQRKQDGNELSVPTVDATNKNNRPPANPMVMSTKHPQKTTVKKKPPATTPVPSSYFLT